jgi:hypothetical protein
MYARYFGAPGTRTLSATTTDPRMQPAPVEDALEVVQGVLSWSKNTKSMRQR